MAEDSVCIICAWRDTCTKRFNMSGRDMRCTDFVKDISIKSGQGDEKEAGTDEEPEEPRK